MAKLIDGKLIAAQIRAELRKEVDEHIASGNRAPQLTAILVGEDPASETYVSNKMKVQFMRPVRTLKTIYIFNFPLRLLRILVSTV